MLFLSEMQNMWKGLTGSSLVCLLLKVVSFHLTHSEGKFHAFIQ